MTDQSETIEALRTAKSDMLKAVNNIVPESVARAGSPSEQDELIGLVHMLNNVNETCAAFTELLAALLTPVNLEAHADYIGEVISDDVINGALYDPGRRIEELEKRLNAFERYTCQGYSNPLSPDVLDPRPWSERHG